MEKEILRQFFSKHTALGIGVKIIISNNNFGESVLTIKSVPLIGDTLCFFDIKGELQSIAYETIRKVIP
jgi:hypothetical protein